MDNIINEHIAGLTNAPIELIEYGDYQCYYCGKAYHTIKEIQKKLGNKLRFVFRNFPLTEMHPNALHAAMAAEAAGAQNKFWEMHDILYQNQKALEDEDLLQYASALKLDMHRFEKDFGAKEYMQKIENDYETGETNFVQGTPTFFINRQRYEGNWMNPYFLNYLQSLL